MTSSAKIVAVSGVPNRAENTALMPQSVAMPPICSAAPSRPALPPNRCVMTVDR